MKTKDQYGKPLKRPFAIEKRQKTEDLYKVKVEPQKQKPVKIVMKENRPTVEKG
jgi:hypothetical protein